MQTGSNPPFGSYPPGPGYTSGPGSTPSARGGNPALRASDADRDRVVDQLSAHFQAGRLTSDEFGQRSSQALQARTLGDLDALLTDLPAGPAGGPAPAAPRPAGPASVRRRDFGFAAAAGLLGVLAVVAVVVLLSTGHGAGGWGFIVPVLILWRVLSRRHHHRDDR